MRKLKGFVTFAIVLMAIVGAAAIVVHLGRRVSGAPDDVRANFHVVKNGAVVHLFGARVGTRVVLFDTGADPGARPVDALLASLSAGRQDVHDIFLTHGHFDHTAGALAFPGARIHLGAGDVDLATGKTGADGLIARAVGMLAAVPPLPRVTHPLTGKASVDVGGGKFVKALPVPGHTRGSYVFLHDEVLLAGDIMVFKQGHLEPTPWLMNPHPEENRAAIRGLKAPLAGESIQVVCTSHGGCTPRGLGRILLDDLLKRVGG